MKDFDPSTFNTGVTEILTETNFCQISKMYLLKKHLVQPTVNKHMKNSKNSIVKLLTIMLP